jgi:hypothetical protein
MTSLEFAKTSLLAYLSLACLIEKSYDFEVYRVVQGFFPGGIHLKMRFGIADSQVDALFRIKAFILSNLSGQPGTTAC